MSLMQAKPDVDKSNTQPSEPDYCRLVRKTCHEWMAGKAASTTGVVANSSNPAQLRLQQQQPDSWHVNVRVNEMAMDGLCDEIELKHKNNPIEWDEEEWHYTGGQYRSGTEAQRKERVAMYILALDAINFCFWPSRDGSTQVNSLEYDTLAVALRKMAEQDDDDGQHDGNEGASSGIGAARTIEEDDALYSNADRQPIGISEGYALSPRSLSTMTVLQMQQKLAEPYLQGFHLPNIQKRCELWNELGSVLLTKFKGSPMRMIRQANGSAPALVNIITSNLPGFQDFAQIDDLQIWFLKRAQIVVGDLNAALQLNLSEMQALSCFADYRVPQILRMQGVLHYSEQLADAVDQEREIAGGSRDEVSIRAATVVAVDKIVEKVNGRRATHEAPITAVEVDWYLWQVGERLNQAGRLAPFHRVRTHFY